jgi:hypothetical protein
MMGHRSAMEEISRSASDTGEGKSASGGLIGSKK